MARAAPVLRPQARAFALPFRPFFRCLAKFRHWSTGNAAAVDPMLHGASLRPGREVDHAKARILTPPGQHHELTGSSDAPAHGFDFTLVIGAEGIIALDLGDVGHAPLFRRD